MSQSFTQSACKAHTVVPPFFGCVKACTCVVLVIESGVSEMLANTVTTKLYS